MLDHVDYINVDMESTKSLQYGMESKNWANDTKGFERISSSFLYV